MVWKTLASEFVPKFVSQFAPREPRIDGLNALRLRERLSLPSLGCALFLLTSCLSGVGLFLQALMRGVYDRPHMI